MTHATKTCAGQVRGAAGQPQAPGLFSLQIQLSGPDTGLANPTPAKTLSPSPSAPSAPLSPPAQTALLGPALPSLPYSRAQVDGEEVLGNQTLVPHVVEDGRGPRGGDAGVGQAQDAVEGRVVQEGAGLRLAQAKDLVGVGDACDLRGDQVLPSARLGCRPEGQERPVPGRVLLLWR